jgi:hypothetical protein
MIEGLAVGDAIALGSAVIAVGAMGVAIWHANHAKRLTEEVRRQADAVLGHVEPLIFLDSRAFENGHAFGGRASLTFVNHNRRDIRLIEIEIKTDSALLVTIDSGELRDVIAAAYQHGRKEEGTPLIIDLRERHHVVAGSSIGVAGSRLCIPLSLTRVGNRNFTQEAAELTAIIRYVLLDARHEERRTEVFARVPFRRQL